MAERTFGWIQEAYKISNLKRMLRLFIPGSDINLELREDKIPHLISEENDKTDFIAALSKEVIRIPYIYLKGKGAPRAF